MIVVHMEKEIKIAFKSFASDGDLPEEDFNLLQMARVVTAKAYAPYSNFLVGAAAVLRNGKIVEGTNQENASFPVGICAERVLLSSASMLYQGEPITSIAISYKNLNGDSNKPITPCGICRQSLAEYEERTKNPIRLILSGLTGEVIVIEKASFLLPLSFGGADMA